MVEETARQILHELREHRHHSSEAIKQIGEDFRKQGETIAQMGQHLARLDERTQETKDRLNRLDKRSAGLGMVGGIMVGVFEAFRGMLVR